jgi:ribosomal protein S18 acetylase RimI-like enzyme
MDFLIRDINEKDEGEIDLVVNRAMETVLETCPEFKGSSELALEAFSNFTFDQMKAMFKSVYGNNHHRTLVAIQNDTNEVVAHSIFSIKTDTQGIKYGFCYSRYVLPRMRRNGIASALLREQEIWWIKNKAEYATAQTHETNLKLQNLFVKHGYEKIGPIQGKHYSCYELKKYL